MRTSFSLNTMIIVMLYLTVYCKCGQSAQIPGLIIQMSYLPDQNSPNTTNQTKVQVVTIYQNNTIKSPFIMNQNAVDCQNTNIFILNQGQNSPNYTWIFSNYTQPFQVTVSVGYGTPTVFKSVSCTNPACTVQIPSNCTQNYSNNLITGTIYSNIGSLLTQFKYYIVCSFHQYELIYQIQWGLVFIAIVSVSMIVLCSKFQQAPSISNFTIYINYIAVIIYTALCLTKFFLIYYQVDGIVNAINIICNIGAVIFGTFSVTLCFGQLCFATRLKILRWAINKKLFKFRVMDAIGMILGIGLLCLWYFLYKNWITSDIIFGMIYFSMIKIVKFGSLKIAIIIFVINLAIDCAFYKTLDSINSTYQNSQFYFYNNPLFLITPNLTHIPNRKCTWYFIISMSFAGLLCAYLQRFDKNKSSVIYCPTFVVCYTVGAILWLILSLLVPLPLPYDLFTVPGAIFFLVIFANRRGQLGVLWEGDFYDQQRDYLSREKQIIEQLRQSKRDSFINGNLLQDLKLGSCLDGSKIQSQYRNQKAVTALNEINELQSIKDLREKNNNENRNQVPRSNVSKSEMPKIMSKTPFE